MKNFKPLVVMAALFLSAPTIAQDLKVTPTNCNSIELDYSDINKYGGTFILEKEVSENIWQNILKANAVTSNTHFENLINGNYRATMISLDKRNIYSKKFEVHCRTDRLNDFEFTLSPNPSSELVKLQFSLNEEKAYHYSINSIDGRELEYAQLLEPETILSVGQFPAGLYLISIYEDGVLLDAKKLSIK